MSAWQYILASLRHYQRLHLAVAAGVAVTTAVITGALFVGDSMRGSLRDLAMQGLGRIDAVLTAEQPFREALVEEWLAAPTLRVRGAKGVPLILTQGSALFRDEAGEVRRAAQLHVVGAPPEFWLLAPKRSAGPVEQGNRAALTANVAAELGVNVGDAILLRLPTASSIPADSTLGEKEEMAATRRFEVAAILDEDDDATFARFSLRPSQQAPRNVFVPLATMQDLLELEHRANAIALTGRSAQGGGPFDEEAYRDLRSSGLQPQLADYGVKVERIAVGDDDRRAYVRISADRLVLPPHVVEVAKDLYGHAGLQPVVTYLANRIAAGDRLIPYSTIAGVDSSAELGPVLDETGKSIRLADAEVALNDWAAKNLDAKIGDKVSIAWYDPETTHGQLVEHEPLELTIRAIVPLADADGAPTSAADLAFAPDLPGVTDQASIDDWDLPFELVEKVREEDEQYWDEHRTTPKAFVSFAFASRLWSTRWGTESVLRLPITSRRMEFMVAQSLREHLNPAEMGMMLLPAKRNALAAASGTTPFDGLFLGFSFFLMASAVMLTALLFRLGVEQRAREVGLLLAVGTAAKQLRWLLLSEAAIVATIGSLIGVAVGVAYARLMVHGLNTWWVEATAAPFMKLHVTARSLVIGFAAGMLVALLTMAWSLRRFAQLPARQLLAGDAQPATLSRHVTLLTRAILPTACIFAAVALGFVALRSEGEAQAGAFFGGGAMVLIGVLLAVRGKLRESIAREPSSLTLAGLAVRNARRNPNRTMLSLALAATASFLIVAMSAFRMAPTDRGVGGFDLLATADVPVLFNLGTSEGRRELGFTNQDNDKLKDVEFISFRVHDGEDASCLNLYQPTQPRILGGPASLAKTSRFRFAAQADVDAAPNEETSATAKEGRSNSPRQTGWELLQANIGDDDSQQPLVPMILDRNTAAYSLKLGLGDQLNVATGAPGGANLQVVGLLANSVLQGDVVISDENFRRLFPEEAGRRFFLIRRGPNSPPVEELASLLETQLEDYGFDAVDARQRLGELLAVQNTYLSTFQSLGALGLLLGVVGLAVVQLRSVLERRGELALMQATGFRRTRLAVMVLSENLVLLLSGLGIGCLAALAAVLPHAIIEQAGTPWGTLALLLGIIAAAGVVAAWLASRFVLRAPLLPALRGD
jgi:putative ABC transport system permease protein